MKNAKNLDLNFSQEVITNKASNSPYLAYFATNKDNAKNILKNGIMPAISEAGFIVLHPANTLPSLAPYSITLMVSPKTTISSPNSEVLIPISQYNKMNVQAKMENRYFSNKGKIKDFKEMTKDDEYTPIIKIAGERIWTDRFISLSPAYKNLLNEMIENDEIEASNPVIKLGNKLVNVNSLADTSPNLPKTSLENKEKKVIVCNQRQQNLKKYENDRSH